MAPFRCWNVKALRTDKTHAVIGRVWVIGVQRGFLGQPVGTNHVDTEVAAHGIIGPVQGNIDSALVLPTQIQIGNIHVTRLA